MSVETTSNENTSNSSDRNYDGTKYSRYEQLRRKMPTIKSKLKNLWKFLMFNEDIPKHKVWHNPSNIELSIFLTLAFNIGCGAGVEIFFLNPIPYITPIGNGVIGGIGIALIVLEACHIIWDR